MEQCRFADLPEHMRSLPLDHRGLPVPWFVAWRDGVPLFQIVEANKIRRAVEADLCWICGHKLGKFRASVIGPMCAVNRISSEPQSHVACARFAALHCPFLSNPLAVRLPVERMPEGRIAPAGFHVERNPGVSLVWIEAARSVPVVQNSGVLFELGEPQAAEWYSRGRIATADEARESLLAGLPFLRAAAGREAPGPRRTEAMKLIAERAQEALDMIDACLA